jgi:hypothetical protein
VRFIDARPSEVALDCLLRERPTPDPVEVAKHDWSQTAERVLAISLASSAGVFELRIVL